MQFRYSEISNILPIRLEFPDEYVTILIPHRKTDIYREGNLVYINKINNKYCPVNLLSRYIRAADIDLNNNLHLFRSIVYHKRTNSYTLRKECRLDCRLVVH